MHHETLFAERNTGFHQLRSALIQNDLAPQSDTVERGTTHRRRRAHSSTAICSTAESGLGPQPNFGLNLVLTLVHDVRDKVRETVSEKEGKPSTPACHKREREGTSSVARRALVQVQHCVRPEKSKLFNPRSAENRFQWIETDDLS